MLIYSDPLFVEHETGRHPENPERLRRTHQHLAETGLVAKCRQGRVTAADVAHLEAIHEKKYIGEVEDFARDHGGYIEADTVVSSRSYDVALHASGVVCNAVDQVVAGNEKRALCLVRPPGHHALHASAMGFCLFNNIAVGARFATTVHSLDRVLVVDWDVHHGNGTQDAFWSDEQVGFFSAHRWPFYPGSGTRAETGGGKGLGTTLNLPVEFGTSRQDYLGAFTRDLNTLASRIKPQLVMISAGFDSHRQDPIGSLGLEVEDFVTLTEIVLGVAEEHAEGRTVSVLEGGYNLEILPLCVAAHLETLLR